MPLKSDKFQIQMFVALVYQTLVLANVAALSYLLTDMLLTYALSHQRAVCQKDGSDKGLGKNKVAEHIFSRDIYHERHWLTRLISVGFAC